MNQRNRIGALIITLVMVFSPLSTLAAGPSTMAKAETLYKLGLFSGTSIYGFSPELGGSANREQAAKMVVVALGWPIDQNSASSFSDVSSWAQPYVAVAVNQGVTNGIGTDNAGNDLFGAGYGITARQLSTWFDRVITGSNTAWEDNANLDNTTGITRGFLVETTFDALMQTPAGATESLIETIVGDDESMNEIALKGGLLSQNGQIGYDPLDNLRPYLTDMDMVGFNKLVLTFSEDLNKATAENKSFYTLYDKDDDEVNGAIDDITLTDENEVTIIFEYNLSGSYELGVFGVEDLAGNTSFEKKKFSSGDEDDGDGSIKSIKMVDENTITVTFKEDLDEDSAEDEDNYTLYDDDNDRMSSKIIDRARLTDDDEVTIDFDEDLDGEYTLEVDGVEDEDGDDIDDKETFRISDDDDGPRIRDIDIEADDKILVKFNEDVDEDTAEDEGNYRLYDSDGDRVTDMIKRAVLTDEREVTITFEEDLEGEFSLRVDDVEDLYGNEANDEEDFEIDKDTKAPTIRDIDVEDEDTITVRFSEDVDEDSAEDEDNYTLYDDDGDRIRDAIDIVRLTDEDEVTITFEDNLRGDYTLEIEDVEDLSGNEMDDQEDFDVD